MGSLADEEPELADEEESNGGIQASGKLPRDEQEAIPAAPCSCCGRASVVVGAAWVLLIVAGVTFSGVALLVRERETLAPSNGPSLSAPTEDLSPR